MNFGLRDVVVNGDLFEKTNKNHMELVVFCTHGWLLCCSKGKVSGKQVNHAMHGFYGIENGSG